VLQYLYYSGELNYLVHNDKLEVVWVCMLCPFDKNCWFFLCSWSSSCGISKGSSCWNKGI